MGNVVLQRSVAALAAGGMLATLGACGGPGGASASELVGRFGIDPGRCDGAEPSGSTFRVRAAGSTPDAPVYVDNVDTPCADQSTTLLAPGSDGGLITGRYQPLSEPRFGDDGWSTAVGIIAATSFLDVGLGLSTDEVEPQTGERVPAPTITVDDGVLNGDLSAVTASWDDHLFHQGAPKPGAASGDLRGAYDAATGRYELDWTSSIEGGPFDGFTGIWHFEGTFTPS